MRRQSKVIFRRRNFECGKIIVKLIQCKVRTKLDDFDKCNVRTFVLVARLLRATVSHYTATELSSYYMTVTTKGAAVALLLP